MKLRRYKRMEYAVESSKNGRQVLFTVYNFLDFQRELTRLYRSHYSMSWGEPEIQNCLGGYSASFVAGPPGEAQPVACEQQLLDMFGSE